MPLRGCLAATCVVSRDAHGQTMAMDAPTGMPRFDLCREAEMPMMNMDAPTGMPRFDLCREAEMPMARRMDMDAPSGGMMPCVPQGMVTSVACLRIVR